MFWPLGCLQLGSPMFNVQDKWRHTKRRANCAPESSAIMATEVTMFAQLMHNSLLVTIKKHNSLWKQTSAMQSEHFRNKWPTMRPNRRDYIWLFGDNLHVLFGQHVCTVQSSWNGLLPNNSVNDLKPILFTFRAAIDCLSLICTERLSQRELSLSQR